MLRVQNLSTEYSVPGGSLRAVDGVDLELERGQTLAIVGESGSGKTALVSSIMGIHPPAAGVQISGQVWLDGAELTAMKGKELRRLWGRKIGIVQQNPLASLNPVLRIGRQLKESLKQSIGLVGEEATKEATSLLEQVGIPSPDRRLRAYPHQLSGGMRQRVAIALALAGRPSLLIADEPTTALDVTVQAQILRLLRDLQRERDMGLIFISHDLAVVSGVADDIYVMYSGRIVERGPARAVLTEPRMPYTSALLHCRPNLDMPSHTRLQAIPGRQAPGAVGARCPFVPRCGRSSELCSHEQPPLSGVDELHAFACFHPVGPDGG